MISSTDLSNQMNSQHILNYYFIDSERNRTLPSSTEATELTTNVLFYLKNLDIQLVWFGQHSLNKPTSDVVTDIREDQDLNIIYLIYANSPNYVSTKISWEDPRLDVIKKALCLMYSRHPDAFDELIQNYESDDEPFSENIKTFYGDIINTVVNWQSYVLK
jgi:hypothetical protein